MDDVVARLALIGGALLVAAATTALIRRRTNRAPRRIDSTNLRAGIYFFSSTACPDCRSARRTLESTLGENGYAEFSWEENPGLFHDLGVDAVPATLVVNVDGTGTLWAGKPDAALVSRGP